MWLIFSTNVFRVLQDAQVADMYKSDRELFNHTAKFWTESYATPKASGAAAEAEAIARVASMGFDEAAARKALDDNAWDENAAVNALLS